MAPAGATAAAEGVMEVGGVALGGGPGGPGPADGGSYAPGGPGSYAIGGGGGYAGGGGGGCGGGNYGGSGYSTPRRGFG